MAGKADDARQHCRRPHAATVETLAGFGLCCSQIALLLDIAERDLLATYTRELATGALKASARVAESLFRRATGQGREAVAASIFWLKTRASWRETHLHEVSSPNQGPLQVASFSNTDVAKALLLVPSQGGEPEHE